MSVVYTWTRIHWPGLVTPHGRSHPMCCDPVSTSHSSSDADGCETRNCLSSPARAQCQTQATQPAPALLGGAQAQSTPALIHFSIKRLALFVHIIPCGLLFSSILCICGAQKELLELKESLFSRSGIQGGCVLKSRAYRAQPRLGSLHHPAAMTAADN